MSNASAFFGAPPPPASTSQAQQQQQQQQHSNRGAMPMHGGYNYSIGGGGGDGMHSRPMNMQHSAPPPPPRYHQTHQQPQQQQYQQQNIVAASHYGAPPSSFEEEEAFETLDLNSNSHHPPNTTTTMPMTSSMGANTNSNDSRSTSFVVSSSSGPENFSNYSNTHPPPTAPHQHQQQQHPHQQQHDNTYRDDGTFEYEGGVALQTALNVFGSVASAAGGLAGGLLAAGGLSGNNNNTATASNAKRMGMGIGGGGNLVVNVATWGNRIVDVVAPTTATTNPTNTDTSMASSSAVGIAGGAGVGVGGPSSHRSASPVFPPLPPQQQHRVPMVVHQHHSQPPPSPMHHHPPTPTMQYRHQQQQHHHRRQSSVASNNSSEAHELFGAATTISTTHAAPATTTTTTSMVGHVRQSSIGSAGGSVGGRHGIGGDSASDFFASSASSQSMGQQQQQQHHHQSSSGSAGDFFNAPPTPTSQTATTSITTTTYNNIAPTPTQTATSVTTTTCNTIDRPTPTQTATMLNTATVTNVAATTNPSFSLPADASSMDNTLPKEEKNERQRQFSHRLSSLEKAKYADPLVGGVGVFAADNDERGGGGGVTDIVGTANNSSMVVGDSLSDPIPIPAAGEGATSTENVTKSESTTTSMDNMASASSSTDQRKQEQSPSTMISFTEQSPSVTTTHPVGKILLPTPSKSIATSAAAAATRQHYLPLPPPLPARKKTPSTGEHSVGPSGTMEKATTTFRKPPPIPGGGGGSNTSTPRFHVPSPRVSPRLSPMTATTATPPSLALRGAGWRAVAEGGTIAGGGGGSTPLVPSLGEGTASATTSPAAGVSPAPATPVDVHQTPTQHGIVEANNIPPMVSVAQGNSVVNFNDDVDCKVEDAVHKIVAMVPPPPPIPHATVAPIQPNFTAQPLVVAPSPTITQSTAQFSVAPAETPTVIDPAIIYSSTSPPIYPNNQIPRTPSSRVTECDVMSDYQMQVCEEDFPDVMLPSPGSHAGGDANSVVAFEDNIMDSGSVSGPSAASMFGIVNGVPPPPQQQQLHAQLPETTPESIVQTPIDADRMNGYREETIEDDFGTSHLSNREENIDPLASMINEENPSDVEPPLLPEGWVECLDANTGRVYFYNENAGTSSWERPVVDDVSAGDGPAAAAAMGASEESEVGLPPTAVSDREFTGEDNIIESIQPEAETPHLDDVKEIEELPEGWEKIVDSTTDKVYYYNSTTGMSRWDCPVAREQNERCVETVASDQQEVREINVNEQAAVGHTHQVEIQTDVGDAAVSDVAEATAVSHYTEEEVVEVLNPPSIIYGEDAIHEATIASEPEISAAKEEDPMPEGWIESRDPTTGGIFYYNDILYVSQWHRPAATCEKDVVDDVLDGHATVTPTKEAALPQSVTEEEEHVEPPPDEVLDQQLESSSTILTEHKISTASMGPSNENEEIAQSTESNTYKEANGNPEDTASILSFESLPPGWIEAIDDNTGLTYYYNEESNETSWDRPLANESKINVADAAVEEEYIHVSTTGTKHVETDEDLVQDEGILNDTTDADQGSEVQQSENNHEGDWTEVTDPDTGKVYYYNRTTNEASWGKPEQNLPAAPENVVSGEVAVEDSEEHVSKEHREIAGDQKVVEELTTVDVVGATVEEEYNDVSTIGTKHVETHEGVVHDDGILHGTTDADQGSEVQQSENNHEGDWTEVTDPDSGKVYYYNTTTNEASWTKPTLKLPAARSSKEAENVVSGQVAVEVFDSEEHVSEYCEIAGGVEEPTTLVEAIDEGWTRVDNPPSVISEEGVETEDHHEASKYGILPDGWQELIDPTTGKVYYYNEVSDATSWTPPEPPLSEVMEESNERLAEEDESCEHDATVESAAYPSEVEDKMADNLAVDEDVGHLEVDMPTERSNVEESKATEGPTSEKSNGTLLPEGWMLCTDPNSGQAYYFNESTGESSWDRPVEPDDETVGGTTTGANVTHDPASSVQTKRVVAEKDSNQLSDNVNGSEIVPTHASSNMSLPDGWIKVDDPSSGGTYYYNESSGETTWERPITSVSQVSSRADHPRPAHAIATFGFGGRLCVMIPQVAATLSGATTVGREYPTMMRRGPVVINRICNVIPRDHAYSIPSSATPSSPLLQTKEDEVLSYLKKKSSNPEDLLWRVINIAAQNRGRLRNEKNAHEAIVDLLLASNFEGGAGGGKKQEDRLPLESSLTSNLAQVQDLIQRGERESAVDEALSQENFALALLIASMCDRDTYRITARRFADKTLPVGSPLHTVALLFSDNVEIPTDEELLDPYGKRAPKRSLWYDDEVYEDLGQSWKEQLASILCNRTAKWENIVLSLGDRLLQLGHCHAAHVCYLVSSSSFGSPSKDTTRLVLIGCDHRRYMNQLLMTPQSIQSFERTEAFEWARRRGNRNTHIPSLQPFKFRYAELLADFGHEELARNYLLSIRSSIGLGSDSRGRTSSGNITPSVVMKDAKFIEALEKLDDRICGSTGAEHASWDNKEISKGGAKSLALGSMVKNVLRKKPSAGQPVPNQDSGFPILQESDDLSPREPESNMPEPSVPEPSIPRQLTEEPKRPQADIVVESALSAGDEHSISSKKSFDRGGLVVGYGSTALSTIDHQGPPSSAPPIFGGGAIMKNVVEKPEIADEDEREKDIVPPTPPPASKKDDKKKAPVSEPPRSAGWLSKLLGRDGESKATVADVGEEMQAYYDEKLKRWIFPGDDPAEVAKPLAPPPIIPKTPVTPALSAPAPAASNDPLAALMAPPPSRGLSTIKKGTSAASRYADPLASTGKRAGASSAGSMKIPPTSPMMAAPPIFAVFQPKPAPAESKE